MRNLREPSKTSVGSIGKDRIAHRISAYVYGNILALGAIILSHHHDVVSGASLTSLLATGALTFAAHTLAERQEFIYKHGAGDHEIWKAALRDSLPVATATLLPGLFLLLGMFGWLTPLVSWLGAVLIIAARLFFTGKLTMKLRGDKSTWRNYLSGAVFAVLAITVALLKALLTH